MLRRMKPRRVIAGIALTGATAAGYSYYLSYEEKVHKIHIREQRQEMILAKEELIARKYTNFMDIPTYKWVFHLIYLTLNFAPLVLTAPLAYFFDSVRPWWYRALHQKVQRMGPAFIKWGQWLCTRKDIFPEELRQQMAQLYNQVPPHSFEHTKTTIESSFGKPLEEIFSEFDENSVGSGSIAQVHRARIRATGQKVAVKVCHPNVREEIALDFRCFLAVAKIATKILPRCEWIDIVGTCDQFIRHLALQVDLTVEGENLRQFNEYHSHSTTFRFPQVVENYVASSVLVETWAEGEPLTPYLIPNMPFSTPLCEIGLAGWLQMLLQDNFLHSDLHPGNILIDFHGLDPKECSNPSVTLVDVGLVLHFTNEQRLVLLEFIRALALKDPEGVAASLLAFGNQKNVDVALWTEDVKLCFGSRYKTKKRYYAGKVTEVLTDVFDMVRKHNVAVDPVYTNLLFSCMLQESFINALDPDFDVIHRAKPYIFKSEGLMAQWLPALLSKRNLDFRRSIT